MSERAYKIPVVAWLKVTDHMHAWLQYELGGGARVGDQKVISVQHLPGARDVLRMESSNDTATPERVASSMSAARRNCVVAGLELDREVTERLYGLTMDQVDLFVPIEAPRMCMTVTGVMRPWTLSVSFGREQASALQRLLRHEFWKAVDRYNLAYAARMNGEKYAQVDMIEAFCRETGTPDLYVEAMRREWQRRVKGGKTTTPPPPVEPETVTIAQL